MPKRTLLLTAVTLLSGASFAQTNTLMLIADDVGVDGIAAYKEGAAPPPTPHIDALAARGVLFRNAYTNPICSPTRATLHTGRYCTRTGVGAVVSFGAGVPLALEEDTLPELLGQNGYATALLGKWHLGDARNGGDRGPNLAGWSHYAGHMWNLKSPETYFSWRKVTNGTATTSKIYVTTDNVNEAITWIQAQTRANRPWHCCVCFNSAHAPFHVPPNALHTYRITNLSPIPLRFKAMVQAIDTEIGRLIQTVGPTVMAKTDVIFAGDNGTPPNASEAPFTAAHAKTSLFEGGINVPLIISGPSVAAPGREVSSLVGTIDLFATVLELAGVDARASVPRAIPLDGISLVPYLRSPSQPALRTTVFAERFGSKASVANRDGVAIRDQTFKLIRWSKPVREAFFNLTVDKFEKVDLLSRPLTGTEQNHYDALARELTRLRADTFPYGTGCAGSAGPPRLELFRDELPRVGGPFVTLIAGTSNQALGAVGVLGLAAQSIALDALGMPGCTLLVGLDLLTAVPIQGGYGVWIITIPNSTNLIGARVFQQAIVVEPGANRQSLLTTHGVRVIVGGR